MTGSEDFLREHTAVGSHPLCPEIKLHLAAEVVPIWQAREAWQRNGNLPPPYWAFCWPGGAALSRYLLDNAEIVRGKRVLDFAAGCGAAAIAAALGGAAASAAEIDSVAAAAIASNALLNEMLVEVLVDDVTASEAAPWDVIVAGDVCYERPMAALVFAWLRRRAAAGVHVLMADPGRDYLPADGLDRVAQFTVPTSMDLEKGPSRSTTVYRVLGAC